MKIKKKSGGSGLEHFIIERNQHLVESPNERQREVQLRD